VGYLFAISILGGATLDERIAGPIDRSRAVRLEGNLSPMAARGRDRGALDPSTPISGLRMGLMQTAVQSADLERLLEAQRDPSSPDYQRWLTPEEYGERFGVSLNDLNQLSAWLASEGFAVQQIARAGNWVAFSGSAAQITQTFRTELHRYQSNGETHFANATEPWIPQALEGLVGGLYGLNDYHPKPPRIKRLKPNLTTSGGTHYLAPDDLAAIYDIAPLYKAGIDGTGQKLAIAGQTDINLADIRGFRAQFGLPAKDPQLVLYGIDPGVSPGDQIEADLDLEWSGAVARNATIIYVYSQDVFESVQYAIDQNLAPVISMSYGECELGAPASYRTMAQQANAEGITWMNSSGDQGAAGCDYDASIAVEGPSVTFPADIPEVTAVGGTEFNESGSAGWSIQNSSTSQSATGYLPEMAWNDTALGAGIWASGGGASVLFAKPWWQTGPGVPNDSARDVPDISLSASGDHDGYVIYVSGGLTAVGGTSASSPSFAGIVTLINQYVVAKGTQLKPGLGNINPNLYALAQNTTGVIHDVTSGNNIVPCKSGSTGCKTGSFGYSAGVGYDLVTGLGSVDAYNLATNWTSLSTVIGTTTRLTANPANIAQSATTQLTARITAVTGSAGPAGSVTFTAGGITLGSEPAIVSGSTASAILSVNGTSLAAGGDSITASFSPSGNFRTSTASATVITGSPVTTETTVVANPASIALAGTVQLTATVTSASGNVAPTGTMTFSVGNIALGTATLAASGTAAAATLSVPGAKFTTGGNSITASYAGAENFTASQSTSITLMVTARVPERKFPDLVLWRIAHTGAPFSADLVTTGIRAER
jgi:subtilase family serine protease